VSSYSQTSTTSPKYIGGFPSNNNIFSYESHELATSYLENTSSAYHDIKAKISGTTTPYSYNDITNQYRFQRQSYSSSPTATI
jgi:hypothetical protein